MISMTTGIVSYLLCFSVLCHKMNRRKRTQDGDNEEVTEIKRETDKGEGDGDGDKEGDGHGDAQMDV